MLTSNLYIKLSVWSCKCHRNTALFRQMANQNKIDVFQLKTAMTSTVTRATPAQSTPATAVTIAAVTQCTTVL